jgi:hypothetical protein
MKKLLIIILIAFTLTSCAWKTRTSVVKVTFAGGKQDTITITHRGLLELGMNNELRDYKGTEFAKGVIYFSILSTQIHQD